MYVLCLRQLIIVLSLAHFVSISKTITMRVCAKVLHPIFSKKDIEIKL